MSFIVRPVKKAVKSVVNVVKKVVNVVTSVVGEVISWFIDIPDQPNLDNEARGALVNKQSNIAQIPVIYGERRVGGTIVFVETSGSNNTYLYLCLVLGEGEVQSIGDVYIDDVLLTSGSQHFNYVTVDKKIGTDAQAASTVLTDAPSWESTDKLSGIAYLGVRLTYNADVFSGIPTITADVQGRKVYDPRTSTTAYSSNPALCLRDYLTNTRYGKGLPTSVIDDVTFSAAANDCDVDVDSYDGGASVKAFSCNAVVLTDKTLFNNVKVFLSGMQGIMPYQNGQYRLFVEKDKASTFDFTTDNMIGGFSMAGSNKSSKYNKVTARFVNPDANWQPDSVIWPDAGSTESTQYLSEDSNTELATEVNLTTVTNYYQARNIAKTVVLASRLAGIRLDITATSEALNCVVGDVVTVTHPTPGWNEKQFRVTRLVLNYDGTVAVSLVEHIAAIYPWVKDKVQPVSAQSTLPNPYAVASVTGLTAESGTDVLQVANDGTVISRIKLSWDAVDDQFVASGGSVEIQYKLTSESVYSSQTVNGGLTSTFIGILEDGKTYNVRVRAVNSLLIKGAWAEITHTVVGKTTPPTDPTGFAVEVDATDLKFSWNEIPDPDFAFFEIRTSATGFGNDDASKVFRGRTNSCFVVPNGVGVAVTYYIKSCDTSGNYSTNTGSASFTVTAPNDITGITEFFSDTSLTSAEVNLSWDEVPQTFGVNYYAVSYNGTAVNIKGNNISLPANWIGNRTFTVTVYDNIGNSSAGFSKAITKLAPNPVSNLRAQVIDNNVLLYWDLPSRTTLPISHALIKKGATWETAAAIGRKDGGFTSLQETQAGLYQYWVAVVDTDDNESTPSSIAVQVAEPPDFIFHGEFTSDFSATKSSALKEDSYLVIPVNLTETFQEHFDDNSWSTPQDQIDAGYPIYIQPANGTGYYEEVFDFGTELASSKITLNYAGTVVAGTPNVDFTISYSQDDISYINLTGVTEAFATNFRYIKIKVTVTEDDGLGVYKLTYLNVRLDAKQRSDSGSVACVSTDTDGTLVNFGKEFIDVTSINISASGTTPLTTVYDFQDANLSATYAVVSNVCTVTSTSHGLIAGQNVRLAFSTGNGIDGVYTIASATTNTFTVSMVVANTSGNCLVYPEGFRVYLFNSSGTRVNGVVSWSIKGY
jgi:hypothetical protein